MFDVYDKDEGIGESDDFLGRATIQPLESAYSENKDEIPEPKWHPIRVSSNAPECGSILVSFSIVEADFNY